MSNINEVITSLGILKPLDEIEILEGKSYKINVFLYSLIFIIWIAAIVFGVSYMVIIQGEIQSNMELAIIGVVLLIGISFLMVLKDYYKSKVCKLLPETKLKKIIKSVKLVSVKDSIFIKMYANSFKYLVYISCAAFIVGAIFGLQYDTFSEGLYMISIGTVPLALFSGITAFYIFSVIFDSEVIYVDSLLDLRGKVIKKVYPSKKYGLVYCLENNEYVIYDERSKKQILQKVISDKGLNKISDIITEVYKLE